MFWDHVSTESNSARMQSLASGSSWGAKPGNKTGTASSEGRWADLKVDGKWKFSASACPFGSSRGSSHFGRVLSERVQIGWSILPRCVLRWWWWWKLVLAAQEHKHQGLARCHWLECKWKWSTGMCFSLHHWNRLSKHHQQTKRKPQRFFASLITEGDKANAWWGKGVYTVRKAPDEWPNVQTLLDNNFRNMLKRDIEKKGLGSGNRGISGPSCVLHSHPFSFLSQHWCLCEPNTRDVGTGHATRDQLSWQNPGRTTMHRCPHRRGKPSCQCKCCFGRDPSPAGTCAASERFGPQTEESLRADFRLGKVLHDRGAYEEAEPLLRRVQESTVASLGPNHPHTLSSVDSLACLLESQGKFTEAEPLQRRALEGREAILGSKHPDTLDSVNNLAYLLESQGKFTAAEPLYRRALEGWEATLGPKHPDTLASVNNLACLLESQGKFTEAEPLYRRDLEGSEAISGPKHPDTLTSVNNLAGLLESQGKLTEAEPLYRRALEGREATLGPKHPNTLDSVNNLACLLESQGKFTEAEPLHRRALEGREATLGPKHPDTLDSVNNLAGLLESQGKLTEAETQWPILLISWSLKASSLRQSRSTAEPLKAERPLWDPNIQIRSTQFSI